MMAKRTQHSLWMGTFLLVAVLTLGVLTGCGPQGTAPAPRATATPTGRAPTPSPLPTASPTPPPERTPSWFDHAVLYEIFVRSFADGDGDGIGDLNGVTQRLDYLQSLGVSVLWLMPIYPSPSYHGYDVTDFFAVNPDYGTLADLRRLVEAAHARGMRVILDFVPSHLSNAHPLFRQAYGNPDSPYSDWFVWTNDAHTTYAGFGNSERMPRFNHYNPEVVDYLTRAALFWLDLDDDGDYTDGVDGFRVDNVTFPPPEFLRALYRAVKGANPEALLLGEAWVHTPQDVGHFFPGQFDALFDFPFYELMMRDPAAPNDGLLAGGTSPTLLKVLLQDEARAYPADKGAVRFLSNHDTDRIATEVGGDPARMRLAAALLAAWPGPVMIYYGEEIGMFGHKGGPPWWDAYRRAPMAWYAAGQGPGQTTWFTPESGATPQSGVSVEEQAADPNSLLAFYRRVFALRQATPALAQGEMTPLPFQSERKGPWVFVRRAEGTVVVVALNFGREATAVTFTPPQPAATWRDMLSDATFTPTAEGTLTVTLPPAGVVWLTPGP